MIKLYVLVRTDLSPSQQAVQAGHGVAEYLLTNPNTIWKNGTLVYLGVKNEDKMMEWQFDLKQNNADHTCFHEPDLNNQITSIACVDSQKTFKKLKLL